MIDRLLNARFTRTGATISTTALGRRNCLESEVERPAATASAYSITVSRPTNRCFYASCILGENVAADDWSTWYDVICKRKVDKRFQGGCDFFFCGRFIY